MGAGALSRVPQDAPPILSLALCQAFLQEDFDLARFELVAVARDGVQSVTLEQLLAEIKAVQEQPVPKEGPSEDKDYKHHDEEESKEEMEDRDGANEEIEGERVGSRGGSSRGGSRPTSKRRRRYTKEEPEEEPLPLSPDAQSMVDALTPKEQFYRANLRRIYVRDLIKFNIEKRAEEALAKVEAEKDEVAAGIVEDKANAYISLLSLERKRIGWGKWHEIKMPDEDEEDEVVEEEDPEIIDSEAEKERKAAEEAALLKEKEDQEILELEIREAKIALTAATEGSLTGTAYKSPDKVLATQFLMEHYEALSKADRCVESLTPSFAGNVILSLIPGQPDFVGRDAGIGALLRAFGNLPAAFSIQKLDVQRVPRRDCFLSFSVITLTTIANDPPRSVMEIYDLVKSKEETLPDFLQCARMSVVVRDNRPLYTFATGPPPKTKHDNMEPHVRALFPPTAEELLELALATRAQIRLDMVKQDAESKLFEVEWELTKARREAERKAAEEKERLAKLFAEEAEDAEDEADDGEGEGEDEAEEEEEVEAAAEDDDKYQ